MLNKYIIDITIWTHNDCVLFIDETNPRLQNGAQRGLWFHEDEWFEFPPIGVNDVGGIPKTQEVKSDTGKHRKYSERL